MSKPHQAHRHHRRGRCRKPRQRGRRQAHGPSTAAATLAPNRPRGGASRKATLPPETRRGVGPLSAFRFVYEKPFVNNNSRADAEYATGEPKTPRKRSRSHARTSCRCRSHALFSQPSIGWVDKSGAPAPRNRESERHAARKPNRPVRVTSPWGYQAQP